jgi:hypothetical protein|tara:strand:- start:278 stop:535 length:258 start_codon:yes stop_codon:yes gene_type:complete
MTKLYLETEQKMIEDNTLGIGEWDEDNVQSLVSEIIHTLQDDYGYLKPQPKSTAGNIQGDGVYNWEAHNVLEDLLYKKFNIKEEE